MSNVRTTEACLVVGSVSKSAGLCKYFAMRVGAIGHPQHIYTASDPATRTSDEAEVVSSEAVAEGEVKQPNRLGTRFMHAALPHFPSCRPKKAFQGLKPRVYQ
jgi:hypothetical protein